MLVISFESRKRFYHTFHSNWTHNDTQWHTIRFRSTHDLFIWSTGSRDDAPAPLPMVRVRHWVNDSSAAALFHCWSRFSYRSLAAIVWLAEHCCEKYESFHWINFASLLPYRLQGNNICDTITSAAATAALSESQTIHESILQRIINKLLAKLILLIFPRNVFISSNSNTCTHCLYADAPVLRRTDSFVLGRYVNP